MPGVDYRGTAGEEGKGFVTADGFVTTTASITFNPPSLATLTGAASSAIDVDGVKLGDAIDLYPPYDMQGVMYQGAVSDDGKIKISLFNVTGSTVDLAEGSWGVSVKRGV